MSPRVSVERRKHPRVRVALDGHWKAESRPGFYHVADLSLGGCFIHAHTPPARGQTGTLTIYFKHDGPMVINGEVISESREGGFALRFPHLTSSDEFQLGMQIETLKFDEHVDHFPVSAYVWKSPKPQATAEPPETKEERSDVPGKAKTPAGKNSD